MQGIPSIHKSEHEREKILFDSEQRRLAAFGAKVPLTSLETRFLWVLTEAPGKMVPINRIVELVWDTQATTANSSQLPKNLVRRLRKKFEPDPSGPQYLLTVRSVGYMVDGIERVNISAFDPSI